MGAGRGPRYPASFFRRRNALDARRSVPDSRGTQRTTSRPPRWASNEPLPPSRWFWALVRRRRSAAGPGPSCAPEVLSKRGGPRRNRPAPSLCVLQPRSADAARKHADDPCEREHGRDDEHPLDDEAGAERDDRENCKSNKQQHVFSDPPWDSPQGWVTQKKRTTAGRGYGLWRP